MHGFKQTKTVRYNWPSASPRRRTVLGEMNIDFKVHILILKELSLHLEVVQIQIYLGDLKATAKNALGTRKYLYTSDTMWFLVYKSKSLARPSRLRECL